MYSTPETPRHDGRKLSLCHVVSTASGARWVAEQLRELRDVYGYSVSAVVPAPDGDLVDLLRQWEISFQCFDLSFGAGRNMLSLPRRVLALARFFRDQRIDIVHSHLLNATLLCRAAAWLWDVPVCVSMVPGPVYLEAPTSLWLDMATYWMDTTIIASSSNVRNLYLKAGVPAARLQKIYYGPDERKFMPSEVAPAGIRAEFGWDEKTPLIGCVAVFYAEMGSNGWTPSRFRGRSIKGHEQLIRAMPHILRGVPNAKLVLVGGALHALGQDVMDKMRDLVSELKLKESVVFAGWRSDVPSIYRDLDVAVQASLIDNLGGTVEALLMACPLVATRIPGFADTVIDGVTGVLAEPDDPQSLARAIVWTLRHKEEAKKLGRAGRARMLEGFTLRTTARQLDALYRNAFQRKRNRGYRSWLTALRLPVGAAIFVGMALRYSLFDYRRMVRDFKKQAARRRAEQRPA